MTDRLKDWLTGQQTETNWPTDRLVNWQTDWLTDWLIDWLTPTDRLTDWLTENQRPTDQLNQTNLLCPQRRSTTVSLET